MKYNFITGILSVNFMTKKELMQRDEVGGLRGPTARVVDSIDIEGYGYGEFIEVENTVNMIIKVCV